MVVKDVRKYLRKHFSARTADFIIRALKIFTRILLIFFFYMIGVIFYTNKEHWNIADSAYFITVTMSTVGYGFFHPVGEASRIFTVFYALVGIPLILTEGNALAAYTLLSFQNRYLNKMNITLVKKNYYKIIVTVCFLFFIVFIGTVVFASLEGWTAGTAFYFTMITILTIGYGDVDINNERTRKFSIFFILFCVIGFAAAIKNLLDAVSDLRQAKLQELLLVNIKNSTSLGSSSVDSTSSSPGSSPGDDDTVPLGPNAKTGSSHGRSNDASNANSNLMTLLIQFFDVYILNVGIEATTSKQLSTSDPLLDAARNMSTSDMSKHHDGGVLNNDGKDVEMIDRATFAGGQFSSGSPGSLSLLKSWKNMSEERFVLDMLLRLNTIDKTKHIDPWIQFHREIRNMPDEAIN